MRNAFAVRASNLHHVGSACGGVPMRTPRGAAAALALAGALMTGPAGAGPIEDLVGYWSGTGTITLADKEHERVKCVAVYRVSEGGTEIRQTLRCATADYNINAKAALTVKGNQVEGTWEEQTYSATGKVTGRYTGSNFNLSIQGANFSAGIEMGLSSCRQSIQIRPKGLEIRRISMSLSKCEDASKPREASRRRTRRARPE